MAALGLGAGTDHVSPHLAAACREAALPLLIVPDGTPFLQVSRAYWDLVGRTEQADHAVNLGLQTSLARAATRPGAAASVVKALAESLGGWAAYLPADGTPESLWPATESRVLPKLREETARLHLTGTHAAATFPLLGTEVDHGAAGLAAAPCQRDPGRNRRDPAAARLHRRRAPRRRGAGPASADGTGAGPCRHRRAGGSALHRGAGRRRRRTRRDVAAHPSPPA